MFAIITKIKFSESIESLIIILLLGFFIGAYINIGDNGALVQKFNIIWSHDVKLFSIIFIFMYILIPIIRMKVKGK